MPGRFSGAVRTARWIRYAIRPPDLVVIHHRDYGAAAAGGLVDPLRADKILAFLTEERLLRRRDVVRPRPASLANVLRVHTAEYVESLADPAVVEDILGVPLGPETAQQALDLARLMVGGTIQATRVALRTGKVAAHLGGGFHHAAPDQGAGFCIFNDVAVAIARLRSRGFDEPILVVDLDLHDGNGTRVAFRDDVSVHTFSIHNIPWDESPAVESTSLALGSGVTDDVLLDVLRRELPPIVERCRPGLIIYVAGVDGAEDDALGDWRLSRRGLLERDRLVHALARGDGRTIPLVVVLAGGYGPSAWRHTARFLGWLVSGDAIEPPDAIDVVLRRFRELSHRWDVEAQSVEDDLDWGLTEADLLGLVTGEDTRFLGHLSRHAIELELEQLGVLNAIRARGFREPTLALDALPGLGQVLRIYGEPERRTLLVELKAQRSRSMVPGFEVIEVDWLLLQNPRADFRTSRPQLPGQMHPGLGMLREIAAWLLIVCERMRLDGITFVPSQYYMAAVGHHHLRFADPERQARFETLCAALVTESIAEGNVALNSGRVVDAATGEPVAWEPAATVLPASPALKEALFGAAYAAAVRKARAGIAFRLV